ncbi:unnamed protein product [Aphanomyces euteiches]|uniref:PH domain-containing protein n=1 Tax=Aphanomyces euteiches TaxID=100861 RepID=A0A6G0WGN6_9STRA|nr:hypothetical protein Ae201684_015421 [Aphanomyces euteiches]KAH9097741.1 hypothetical protein Ae201684P_001217 [Aphanomyces euteiches]KAH9151873.1 hypothetical protein AeRB84_005621 [Aphanomyces euteiches]
MEHTRPRPTRWRESIQAGTSPGADIFGKLTAILRGHNYAEMLDDEHAFDDPYASSPSPSPVPMPFTPVSTVMEWTNKSPRRQSRADRHARRSMSPRPSHDAILVTEFKFLHATFAPPFPLAKPEEPASPPILIDEEAIIDPDNLRDSVQNLVWHIQQNDPGSGATGALSDLTTEDNNNEDSRARLICPSDPLSSDDDTASRVIESSMDSADERSDVLTTSMRNLVLNLRRDCAQQSLQPSAVTGMPPMRRRGVSHPPPDDFTPQPAPAVADKNFSRLMTSVAGSLRRLSIHKMKPKVHVPTPPAQPDIDGARWKIVELAFRFGGPHRYYLVQAVNMFSPLMKFGRRGGPHATRLVCHPYGTLQWEHKRGGFSAPVDLALAVSVMDGRQTPVFSKYDTDAAAAASRRDCSLSVVFGHRTLDLETQSRDHRDWLGSALRTLMQYAKKQRHIETLVMEEESKMMAPIIA